MKGVLSKVESFLNKIIEIAFIICGGALLILLGIEVFFRYVLNNALSWPEEVAGFVFVWFTLLGTAYLVNENSHISFSILSSKGSRKVKTILFILSQIAILAYAYFMIVPGYNYVKYFGFVLSPAASIKMKWVYLAIPISGILIFIYVILNFIKFLVANNESK